jgi:hypothetical protein
VAALYLRNVPDDVMTKLKLLAEKQSMSVNAYAVRELSEASRIADNAAILASLPVLGLDAETIVAALQAERDERAGR